MNPKEYFSTQPKGRQAEVAKGMGVSPSMMSQMVNGDAPISPERAVQFEQLTNGQVSRKDIYKDTWANIWPELIDRRGSNRSRSVVRSSRIKTTQGGKNA
jgi:DNA-binding transcriptional regulator YdaS (Cro superfamily)